MAIISANNLSQTYKNEYSAWRENKKFQEAKRQEYLRANPDAIKEYDRQRAKVLLSIVDSVDKSVSLNSDHMNTVVDSITSLGLGYAAVSGAALGLIFQRLKFVQKFISNIVTKYPKSKNLVSMGITTLSGVLGVVVAYPAYAFFSNMESKIDRKKRFDTMEKELQDPKIFAALDVKQNLEFLKNLSEIDKAKDCFISSIILAETLPFFTETNKGVLLSATNVNHCEFCSQGIKSVMPTQSASTA